MRDKIAAIRRRVEERADLAKAPARLSRQVVIYGVPLDGWEIGTLRATIERSLEEFGRGGAIEVIWEMLERGKK